MADQSADVGEHARSGHRGWRPRPPVVALLCLLGAWGLSALWSGQPRLVPLARGVGAGMVGTGLLLGAWAVGLFHRRGTTHHPFGQPSALVVSGPYRFSRNPMYVAVAWTLCGLALWSRAPVMLLAPVAFLLILDRGYVPREERLLAATFGTEFDAYRRRVRRWL
ncbi:MAG: isoprenylcysteine carboxylmethyltransferase family protein [Lentisphaerae bacterium]|nr:isoprenylcysteine carboxylmethyltransferase family protein [Lentisphaerota bacterium]